MESNDKNDLLWLNDTACAELSVDDFFVEAGHAIDEEILRVCQGCPVRVECVRHVYTMQVANGYFAGMSPGQRRDRTMDEAVRFVELTSKTPTQRTPISKGEGVMPRRRQAA